MGGSHVAPFKTRLFYASYFIWKTVSIKENVTGDRKDLDFQSQEQHNLLIFNDLLYNLFYDGFLLSPLVNMTNGL